MSDLLAARLTMTLSLGFHIILAAIGMIMPFLLCLAHRRWLKTGSDDAYRLTRAWARGVAIFFATGAVSGTALSFELGVLWPEFMRHAGPIISMPFSLEGAAFFVEAIALGIYLYGWGRLSPKAHWFTSVIIGVSGLTSGILVISANGWMNSPTGFTWADGQAHNIDPWAALLNAAWLSQSSHMVIAAFQAVGFAVAGVHAWLMLRNPNDGMHPLALRLALGMGAVFALIQPFSGHFSAQDVATRQPVKLAAMEALFETQRQAPLLVGGIPNEETGEVSWGIELPGLLSLMAFNDLDAEVQGLDKVSRDLWPPVTIVHVAFQIMVGLGSWMALVGLVALFGLWRQQAWLFGQRFLKLLIVTAPLGFIAIEAGWTVTEVGRQPWIIYGIMRTVEGLTPVPGQIWHLLLFTMLYAVVGFWTIWMWQRQVRFAADLKGPPESLRRWAGFLGGQHG